MARTKKELKVSLPSDPAQRARVKDAVNEMVDSMLKVTAEKEYTKGVVDVLKEDLELDPKYIKKLAKIRYDELYGDNSVKADLESGVEVVSDSEILFGN